jgi:hypothetical protein
MGPSRRGVAPWTPRAGDRLARQWRHYRRPGKTRRVALRPVLVLPRTLLHSHRAGGWIDELCAGWDRSEELARGGGLDRPWRLISLRVSSLMKREASNYRAAPDTGGALVVFLASLARRE